MPPKPPPKRDVGPLLQIARDIIMNRKSVNFLRFADEIAPRTQPPPKLPDGPHSKLAANYYYTRDARGLVKPETVLFDEKTVLKLPEEGGKLQTVTQRIPGKIQNWDM